MKILTGLFDHMVVQRTGKNVSDALFFGECSATGRVIADVWQNGRRLQGFAGKAVGIASKGHFQGKLAGLPAGGPYDVRLAIQNGLDAPEEVRIADLLVGDVWILGGQSNMQGCGYLKDAARAHPQVRAFYMTDTWGVAKDPLHVMYKALDPVHRALGATGPSKPHIGTGPGVAFGKEMQRLTGVPQGLLACAHGGTSMSQWDPALKGKGGHSLYGATLRRFNKNGGKVAGIIWYQGESDAQRGAVALYTQRTKKLAKSFRKDLNSPKLPFVLVQISRVHGAFGSTEWNSVQEQQRRLPKVLEHCATVPAIDLALDDLIHVAGREHSRLGRRLAQAMQHLLGGAKAAPAPIALKNVRLETNKAAGTTDVFVEFANVVGALKAHSRPHGFELGDGSSFGSVYAIELQGNTARLRTTLAPSDAKGRMLHYGAGTAPYCNITDEADRSLPVFGPVFLDKPRLLTPFVNTLRVSKLLPSAGKLDKLAYPKDMRALGLATRSFSGQFCDRHLEFGPRAPEDVLAYYVCELECPEPMDLLASLGYDGPVKLWIDGKQRFHDPKGTNPANAHTAQVPLHSKGGKHEIAVALASNCGKAWGIFLRFERLGVPARTIKENAACIAMPKIL